ncbi:MAG TPA: cytochrome c biogenesis protein CcdA, partial [Candidatus Peribacterales bacterium]|nr:cytochrome c biogenesis protein CcdA [Candidatus Peribacterales bacterium]
MTLFLTMFAAGALTILLPCILPLIPIVLGVSIAGKHRLRPLFIVLGMLLSFVGLTFLLQVVLNQFVETADYLRIATYEVLFLFGLGFAFQRRSILLLGALLGGLFFLSKGLVSVIVVSLLSVIAMELGGRVASMLQQFGTTLQGKTTKEFGSDAPITAFIIGLTLGLIWVPCAGPALGFALALVREEPGLKAFLLLLTYGAGTAVPLLAIGYGGQAAVRSVRALTPYTGMVKKVAGIMLILTAIALHFDFFTPLQTFLAEKTGYGTLGTNLENALVDENQNVSSSPPTETTSSFSSPSEATAKEGTSSSSSPMGSEPSPLPRLSRASELQSVGPWHNSPPLSLKDLRGKVVLVDFWTYSCINCIRTLPYMKQYWEKYKNSPFVLIGVHAPEFVFEKSEENVKAAISKHELMYPIVQDNDFVIWRAFANHYWPAKYLIDAEGYIRYTHFGEGAYEETDEAIESLLREIGTDTSDMPEMEEKPSSTRGPITPETYLGERSWPALENAKGSPSDEVVSYSAPTALPLHHYALVGDWQLVDGERQVLQSDEGEIRIRALAGEVNLVLGLAEGVTSVAVEVFVDGEKTQSFIVDYHDLYPLFKGAYGEHEVTLRLHGKGVEGYAYTFGS